MCLGELREVVSVGAADGAGVGGVAEVRVGDRVRSVSLVTLDEPVHPGEWILVHSGFALGRLTADEAREANHIRTGVEDAAPDAVVE